MEKFEQIKGNHYTSFSLRISEDIMDSMKMLATKHKRSINKEIEFALEKFILENEDLS